LYTGATDALLALVRGEEKDTAGIPWKLTKLTEPAKLANGIAYCSVEVTFANGLQFGVTAYGEEAIELRERASTLGLTDENMPVALIA
jgi:hypothetical protein